MQQSSSGFYSSGFLGTAVSATAQIYSPADSLWQQMIRTLSIEPAFTFASLQTSLCHSPSDTGESVHTILLSQRLPTERNTKSHFFTNAFNANEWITPALIFPNASCILATRLL